MSSRTLVIDKGNTFIKIVVFEGGKVLFQKTSCDDHWEEDMSLIVSKIGDCKRALYSSVGKENRILEEWIQTRFKTSILLNKSFPNWLKELHKIDERLGCDRLGGIVGAYSLHKGKNILVIDSGTAITYDFLNEQGERVGGFISPGVRLRFSSLHQYTALLPLIDEFGEIPTMGYDTETEMRSGIIRGVVYEMAQMMEKEYALHPNLAVLLVGGNVSTLSPLLKESTKVPFEVDSFLVSKGLNVIANHDESYR
ncbi:MAG TPA: hypothetical protein DDY68_02620 [Porphyromonadaceae bacterium]|nr:hypothetical protein [Porphyromonadaceae bacterium]